MKKKVLVYSRVTPDMTRVFEDSYDFIFIDGKSADFEAELKSRLGEVHGLIGANVSLDSRLLDEAPNLEAVSTVSVGYDKYDLDYLNRRGIPLTNTPGILTETTADLAFTLLMCCARRVAELDRWTKGGAWNRIIDESKFGVDIHRKRIGIIGMGRIGTAIARRAHFGFGMEVLYCGREKKAAIEEEVGAKYRSLKQLISESDFILPVVPLNRDTRGLIGEVEFELMKESAILVNVSRGAIIDEAALVDALGKKRIFAAGLDVYQNEPLQDSPLFGLDNVITLPHIGSATRETREAMAMYALESLIAVLEGKAPENIVNSP